MLKRMNIMRLNRLLTLLAISIMSVACYEEFTSVPHRELYTDTSFEEQFPEA